jgi:nucleotide-binding universal stress UspA family protein
MSLSNKYEKNEFVDQVLLIRETIKTILKNAKYGSNENLLRDLSKIDIISSKMQQSELVERYHTMRKYKKILVPYDGSSFSKNALGEGLEIAKVFGSKIYVLSIIEVASDIPSDLLSEVINKKINQLKHEISLPKKISVSTKLQRQIDRCAKYGVEVQVEILIGRTADSILKFANQNKIDLIIIGSQGLHGMKKLAALGSVSRRVSEESKCPVMIIR